MQKKKKKWNYSHLVAYLGGGIVVGMVGGDMKVVGGDMGVDGGVMVVVEDAGKRQLPRPDAIVI